MNDTQVGNAVELYERLREKAEKNVRASGVENLAFELCEWRVEDNLSTKSKDLLITVSINGSRKTLTIRYDQISLHARGEANAIKQGRIVADRIRKELADFVAKTMGETVFRGCAGLLVRSK